MVGSKLVVYTQEFNKIDMLNILHIHVNDTSDSVTMSVSYMSEGHSLKDFSEFTADASGQMLRYKIIVKDQKIFKLLYYQGAGEIIEVPYEEKRLNLNDLVLIPSRISGLKGALPVFGRIEHAPIGMMACPSQEKLNSMCDDELKHHMRM